MPLAAPPPEGLEGFPRRPLAGVQLFRIVRSRYPTRSGPWWFATAEPGSRTGGRYDLQPPHGACYLATSMVGAALEVFQSIRAIPGSAVADRRLFAVRAPPSAPPAADVTAPAARGWGVTAELSTTADRHASRAWAEALHAAGWRALHGFVRHDPAQRERTITLFDRRGAHLPFHDDGWQGGLTEIDVEALSRALDPFGVVVLDELRDPRVIALEDTDL